jgi:hypothetical protein
MALALPEHLAYYASPGIMTNPGNHADLLKGLPGDLETLCRVVQGNLLHVFWAERYGVTLTDEQKSALQIRPLAQKLARLRLVDDRPVLAERPPEKRQAGNCRDFTLMLCSLLRFLGIPARARCGFAAYFLPDHYEDHWVCEVWSLSERRWVLVDAQLDSLKRQALNIPFNVLDVPRGQFITAGEAWQMCRRGQDDPVKFGIQDMQGWWFIWGNVVRDFMALNKVEILPWDGGWGFLTTPLDAPLPSDEQLHMHDRIAALTLAETERFEALREAYKQDERWRLPQELLIGARA